MASIEILDQVPAADVCLVIPVPKDKQKATSSLKHESFHTSSLLDFPDNHVIKFENYRTEWSATGVVFQ